MSYYRLQEKIPLILVLYLLQTPEDLANCRSVLEEEVKLDSCALISSLQRT
jgi:hypothetical protein